jgi:uroporphyrin-3 C-methyltransferase
MCHCMRPRAVTASAVERAFPPAARINVPEEQSTRVDPTPPIVSDPELRDATAATPGRAAGRGARLATPASLGAMLAVAIALLGVAGLAWFDARNAQQALRADVARRFSEEDAALAQANARGADLNGQLHEAQAKLALLDARLSEAQAQQTSLEALYRSLAPSRDEIVLTEIEQMLLLASQQLALAGNARAALAALQLADGKLSYLDRPQFIPLRRALARDMDALKAVPHVDVAGMAVKLDQVQAALGTLPLARDERLPEPIPPPAPADEAPWLRSLRGVWTDVKSLVRIEVSDRPAAPLIAPSQQYFLRENLRLRLLSARVALLSRDESSFRADVNAAGAWLRQYFDLRTTAVQAAAATLAQLAATTMPSELPDVAASLAAVRTLKPAHERAPERPAVAAPAAPR